MLNDRKKAIVSACLLGENCRYDGKTKGISAIEKAFNNYEIIPFCPEAPLFGTPRERISVVKIGDKNRIVTDKTNIDVTKALKDEIDIFMQEHPGADVIVLKSKSPSCGLNTTPILNRKKEIIDYGNGIAADMFEKNYKKGIIKDEKSFI